MCTIVAVRSADLYLPPGSRTEYLGSRDFLHSWWDHLKNFHRAECIKSLAIIHDRYTMFSPLVTDPVDAAVTQQWCHRFFRWSSYGHAVQSSPGPSKYPVTHMRSAVNDLCRYIATKRGVRESEHNILSKSALPLQVARSHLLSFKILYPGN